MPTQSIVTIKFKVPTENIDAFKDQLAEVIQDFIIDGDQDLGVTTHGDVEVDEI